MKRQGSQSGSCAELQRLAKANTSQHFKSGRRHGKEGKDGREDEEIGSPNTGNCLDVCVDGNRAPEVEPGQL